LSTATKTVTSRWTFGAVELAVAVSPKTAASGEPAPCDARSPDADSSIAGVTPSLPSCSFGMVRTTSRLTEPAASKISMRHAGARHVSSAASATRIPARRSGVKASMDSSMATAKEITLAFVSTTVWPLGRGAKGGKAGGEGGGDGEGGGGGGDDGGAGGGGGGGRGGEGSGGGGGGDDCGGGGGNGGSGGREGGSGDAGGSGGATGTLGGVVRMC